MICFRILDTLRSEGLLAQPKVKTSGGVSFEVVDSSLVENQHPKPDNLEDTFVSARFIPQRKIERMEERRTVSPNCKFFLLEVITNLFDLEYADRIGENDLGAEVGNR